MKKITLTLIFTLTIAFVGFSQQWEVFQSYEGKFSVLAPGTFTKKENPIKTDIGELKYITYLYQPEEKETDNLVYMISYCDYPDYTVHSDSTELVNDFFQATVATAVESVEGELSYTTEISKRDFPGRLWRVVYNEGQATIKTKAYLVENRYYSVQVITLKEKAFNLKIDKFLDSFVLGDGG
ncbi:MAG: hypothetical protein AAF573_14775 [Bacteroidota bacterium]